MMNILTSMAVNLGLKRSVIIFSTASSEQFYIKFNNIYINTVFFIFSNNRTKTQLDFNNNIVTRMQIKWCKKFIKGNFCYA